MRCFWIAGAAVGLFGCTDLGEFEANGVDRAFVGAVLGAETEVCDSDDTCSFIRRGLAAETRLTLTFDPNPTADIPGTLTTDDTLCGGPVFSMTPLRRIEPLARDALSLYEFPGPGRLRNYIFLTTPESGPFAGRDTFAFVSLLRRGKIEVRLINGTGRSCHPEDCEAFAAGECDLFAVFALEPTALMSGIE